MTTTRMAWIALGSVLVLSACNSVTEQDKANAKRRVEMDSQQAAIIGDGKDCGKLLKSLDGWYATNKGEVDKLDQWMGGISEGQERKLMEPYEAERKANLKARLLGTISCGFVPWNGRREPDAK